MWQVAFGAVDCTTETAVCGQHDVTGYPTFKYFNYGKDGQKYTGGREVSVVLAYMCQGSHGDWITWKMKMVMEKSWNMENWPKSHGILLSVIEFYQFCPQMYQSCMFFATTKKLTIDLESLHFATCSVKCRICKITKRDGHEKLTNVHGKVMENILSTLWEP